MKFAALKQFVGRHRKLLSILLILLILIVVGIVIYWRWQASAPVNRVDPDGSGTAAESTLKIVPSPLTGEPVSEELAKRPVTGVIIENSPAARPQSGLNDAGVMFEAIAEGGITRFLAFYQEAQPNLIGPVRSLRSYFLDWAMGYEASIAHVGGSAEALQQIRTLPGARDLDQFSGGKYFFRSSDRFAPHNMYTRMSLLDQYTEAKGFGPSEFEPTPRKDDAPAETPDATAITINYSSSLYQAVYAYDATTNTYTRSHGTTAHLDRESGQPLRSNVLVVMHVPFSLHRDGQHSVIGTIGAGDVWVFQDGTVVRGTWKKTSRTSMITLIDKNGEAIELNRGQIWYGALPDNKTVNYE